MYIRLGLYLIQQKDKFVSLLMFPLPHEQLDNWLNLSANPSTVAGRNFTFVFISVISMDSSDSPGSSVSESL